MKLLRTVSAKQIAEAANTLPHRVRKLLTGSAGYVYTDDELERISEALNSFGIRVSAKELRAGPGVSSNPVLVGIRHTQEIKRTLNTLKCYKDSIDRLLS